jgi:glucokinase
LSPGRNGCDCGCFIETIRYNVAGIRPQANSRHFAYWRWTVATFAVGVDLGGTNLRVAAVDDEGETLESVDAPTEIGHGRESVVARLADTVRFLSSKYSSSHSFMGVGVGLPGIIDLETGTLHSAANLPGWSGYAAREDLEERLGTTVILENDANCAALGEKWLGAGRDVDDLCMITLGTGVGGGFVVNGKPWHGVMGMAGELGHMTVMADGRACGCGNHGCLEQYASATAIQRMATAAADEGRSKCLVEARRRTDSSLSARSVHACAQAGDVVSIQIFDEVGSALGIALANLINAFNLPLYIIGGGVAKAWNQFSPTMFHELRERSVVFRAGEQGKSRHRSTEVRPALLQDRAGLLGAARLPMIVCRSNCKHSLAS